MDRRRAVELAGERPGRRRRLEGLVPPHTGLVPISLFLACALVVRNPAVSDAFTARALEERKRKAAGLAPRTRRRRRRNLADVLATSP
jgi:hypothetical protein